MPAAPPWAWLERLIWVLIYGGLLTLVLGVAVARRSDPVGACLMAGGAVVALLGALLIWVRSRLGGGKD